MQQPLFCYKTDLLDQILLADFLDKTTQLYSLVFQVLTSRPCLSQPQFLNWDSQKQEQLLKEGGVLPQPWIHLKTSLRCAHVEQSSYPAPCPGASSFN